MTFNIYIVFNYLTIIAVKLYCLYYDKFSFYKAVYTKYV